MVIYDQKSYMTILGMLEVMFTALCEGIQIGSLLFEEGRKAQAILEGNFLLAVYPQMVVQDPVFV